jgi:hypothetical protein
MNGKDVVKTFLEKLVDVEVHKVLPFVANLLPGVPGELARSLLANPEVQAKLQQLEVQAVDAGVDFLAHEIDLAKKWVLDHTQGKLHSAVQTALAASPPGAAHLTADQVRYLAVLAAAGKLDDVLRQALRDLGLLQ